MNYSVLILGYNPVSWDNAIACVQQIFLNLKDEFSKLDHVETTALHFDYPELPKVDFVIVSIFNDTPFDFEKIREKTKAKKICSFIETPLPDADHSFIFNPIENENCTLIKFPYSNFLNVSKKSNTILIDHYWEDFLETEKDWTFRIEDWLEERDRIFIVKRLLRFPDERKTLRNFEIPIDLTNYKDYLEKTDDINTFVVTHRESFGYGIVDMIVRGTRVISPPDLLPEFMINELKIPIFHNKEEFLSLLSRDLEVDLEEKRKLCTSYKDVVKIIDSKFKEWLC